jgi:hypothetical protein
MTLWSVLIGGILFFGILIIPLRSRWYMGCGFALLGAILIGGSAFASSWYYMKYVYTPPPNRDINDWSGLVVAVWLVGLPVIGAAVGSVLGIVNDRGVKHIPNR